EVCLGAVPLGSLLDPPRPLRLVLRHANPLEIAVTESGLSEGEILLVRGGLEVILHGRVRAFWHTEPILQCQAVKILSMRGMAFRCALPELHSFQIGLLEIDLRVFTKPK